MATSFYEHNFIRFPLFLGQKANNSKDIFVSFSPVFLPVSG